MTTPLTAAQSEALAADYRANVGVIALAKKYGIARQTVREHLKRHGLAKPMNYFTEEQGDRAAELYRAGMTLGEVAEEIGSNTRNVTLALEARGIARRRRGERAIRQEAAA